MAREVWVALCLALAAPSAFAQIHKCVDERTGRVAFSDLPCRSGEAQTALPAPRAGTRPTPAVGVPVENFDRAAPRPLQFQGSPQSVLATAMTAVRQMADTGEGCQLTLAQRRAGSEAPAGCRDFLAQVNAWRAPVTMELARLSVDKDFTTPANTARLSEAAALLGKVRGYEEFALQRLGPDAGSVQARR